MKVTVHHHATEVLTILEKMGLGQNELEEAAKANFFARAMCTPNDASTAAGTKGYFDTVRNLADSLTRRGYQKKDVQNSPRIISPKGDFSIMIATGDEATGNLHLTPKTKSDKGNTTISDVDRNRQQLQLFSYEQAPQVVPFKAREEKEEPQIKNPLWVFLVYVHVDRSVESPKHIVRYELSLPVEVDEAGKISAWRERIIFPEINIDPGKMFDKKLEYAPEEEIEIKRKS